MIMLIEQFSFPTDHYGLDGLDYSNFIIALSYLWDIQPHGIVAEISHYGPPQNRIGLG